jgi:hypothetical protein
MLRHDQPVTARGFQSTVVQYTLTYTIAWLVWIPAVGAGKHGRQMLYDHPTILLITLSAAPTGW